MPRRLHHPTVSAVLILLLAGCAATTPPPEPREPAPAPVAVSFPDAAQVCSESTRRLPWSELGVADGYRFRDLALSQEAAWVLLDPPTVVRVPRDGGAPQFLAPRNQEQTWSAVDVDPLDGTLWIALRNEYRLLHLDATGSSQSVSLTRVAGEGGLADVRAGADGLFTQPFCADHAVWTIERSGEMVVAAFRAPESMEDAGSQGAVNLQYACARVYMARGPEDEVVAFDPVTVQLHRAHGPRTWSAFAGPFDLDPPGRYTASSDLRVATLGDDTIPASEAPRYLPDLVRGLFYLRGEPYLLGSVIHSPRPATAGEPPKPLGTLLYRVQGGVLTPVFESCGSTALLSVETDAHGFAALTPEALLLGDTPAGGG